MATHHQSAHHKAIEAAICRIPGLIMGAAAEAAHRRLVALAVAQPVVTAAQELPLLFLAAT